MSEGAEGMTTLRQVADADPFPYYAKLAQEAPVSWDAELGAWVVASYDGTKAVMRQDEDVYRHIYSIMMDDPAFLAVEGGPRVFTLLQDEDHARMHRWLLRQFTPRQVDLWRDELIRPIVHDLLDRIDGTSTDLFASVAQLLPSRVIASLLGMPWQDDAWMARCAGFMDQKLAFLEAIYTTGTDEIAERTMASMKAFKDHMRPYVPTLEEATDETLTGRIALAGRDLLEDWGDDDTLAMATNLMFVGSDTTMNSISSALYVLLDEEGWAERIRGDDRAIRAYCEEILRLYGATHFRPRIATRDAELEGVPIQAGDRLINLHSAANRDPARYACPHAVDLERKNPRDHMAFSSGPRVCVGAALARAEMEEVVTAVLDRFAGLRPDPEGRPATYTGYQLRAYQPLDVVFERLGSR